MCELNNQKHNNCNHSNDINNRNNCVSHRIDIIETINRCHEVGDALSNKRESTSDFTAKKRANKERHCDSDNSNKSQKVEKLFASGLFDYYISRYEYELKCFDRGNDLFERERLGLVSGKDDIL